MKKQNYSNHVMYYPLHHFIFLPLMTGLTITGFVKGMTDTDRQLAWLLFGTLSFCILYLGIMLRQHYALGNQNRIVRLEFRLRYFELTGRSASEVEEKLTFSQVAALRFADDNEFMALMQKTINENLSDDDIKKSIQNWVADSMRV